ncbi:Zn(2)-C6 fungal-type domain-containing protein [Mycena venus]|uniref:Zn(2)-C6 fungal-type domain-containing protein n=1 Tax=Mycena venus TaxID=2733690 RepID=A0A8H7CTW7_9AGAR|nr:Zn(2)-C6 fungal-type domain-containing protein [Mycena venus]
MGPQISFHEAIVGPGPRPDSFSDALFFSSQRDVCNCGVRRIKACHALHAAALAAAWGAGTMLKVSNENAASCGLLDLIELMNAWWSESDRLSRPWGVAYFSHLRALAPVWLISVRPHYAPHWAAFLMGEALLATKGRKPPFALVFLLDLKILRRILSLTLHSNTHEDQLLLCGDDSPSMEELLMALEGSADKPGSGVLFRAMMPYAFHITQLCRQLWRTITGGHARLRPLSGSVVLQFMSSLSLIRAILSNLLVRADSLLAAVPPQQMSFVLENVTDDGMHPARLYTHARERTHLLRAQVRDMARLAVRALLRMFRRLPIVLHVPFPHYAEYLLADTEATAEQIVDPERMRDLATMAAQIKMMGYHLNIFSSENTTLLL